MNQRQRQQVQIQYINDSAGFAYKTTTIILDILLFILCLGVFGFAVWLAVWTNDFNKLNLISNNNNYEASYILLIIGGSLIIVFAFVGCCGSQQENSCLILIFISVAIISSILLLVSGILSIIFNQEIKSTLSENVTKVIQTSYGINSHIDRYKQLTDAIDFLQKKYKCCGTIGEINSTTGWYVYRSSAWWTTQNKQPPYVPQSCCVLDAAGVPENLDVCQGKTLYNGKNNFPPTLRNTNENPFLHTSGCLSVISSSVEYFTIVIFVLCIVTVIIIIITIILTCLMLRKVEIGKKYKENKETNPNLYLPKSNNANSTNLEAND